MISEKKKEGAVFLSVIQHKPVEFLIVTYLFDRSNNSQSKAFLSNTMHLLQIKVLC
jgi:hypothetical protein